jgi:uncharacterized glyoxalase superfamily protein PhnB
MKEYRNIDGNLSAKILRSINGDICHFLTVSSEEVDEIMAQAKKAGAKIIKAAQKTFYGGYAGYFQDPDGHLWEIAWNPAWKIEE